MKKKILALILAFTVMLSFAACFGTTANNQDAQTIQEAQPVVDKYLAAFSSLNLKAMAEETDAQIDYTQMEYLSLSELKSRILAPFAIFEALGISVDEFSEVADKVFASYEKYASYNITNSQVQGTDVVFTVNIEYISLNTMSEIINTAVNRIDYDALESQITGSALVGGIMAAFGGSSISNAVKTALTPIIETAKIEIDRSIEQITPQKGTITLVVTKVNGEWVISDSRSDVTALSGIFN